jgi:DNA-binding transcriptional ArsR family regulator
MIRIEEAGEVASSQALAAKLFRGFADPTRLSVLLELVRGERRVVDLVSAVGTSQSNISGHLACLKDCGLVADRPEGRQVFYRIARPEVYGVLQAAEDALGAIGHAVELCPNYQLPASPITDTDRRRRRESWASP